MIIQKMIDSSEIFVYLIIRIVLGILFFFQAYDKIFRIKLQNVFLAMQVDSREKGLPDWFTKISIFISSYFELFGGLFIVIGLFTIPVLYVFGTHFIMLFISFSYLNGVWDMRHVFPRFVLLLILLLLPYDWNKFSIDYLLFW
jgi:putative oxidoreductase